VRKILGFTPKKALNKELLSRLWRAPDQVAIQVEVALRQAQGEKEKII
jgi:hypothetical protein